jgi:hypothetical protein
LVFVSYCAITVVIAWIPTDPLQNLLIEKELLYINIEWCHWKLFSTVFVNDTAASSLLLLLNVQYWPYRTGSYIKYARLLWSTTQVTINIIVQV